jgi:hypothetical protein
MEYAAPLGLKILLVLVSTKMSLLTELAELDAFENPPSSHLTPLPCKFIFDGVKPALHKTQRHPTSKYVGGLKTRGQRSDDLADALRGIQRGLDEMKAGTGKPFRVALDEIRAKHNIPLPKP